MLFRSEDTSGGVLLANTLDLLGSGVINLTLLWLSFSSWEDDQFVLVLIQSLDVGVHHFSVLVVSSVVDSNTNGLSESWGKLGLLKLSESETSAELNL